MSEEDPSITRPVTPWNGGRPVETEATPSNDVEPVETEATPSNDVEPVDTVDTGTSESQSSYEELTTKELVKIARVIGRVALKRAGVRLVEIAAKGKVGYSKVRYKLAETTQVRARDKLNTVTSSELHISEIRDAAIRTVDKSATTPEQPRNDTGRAKGDYRSRFKEIRMERKIDDHADAARKNKRLRNNTGTVRSPVRSRARRMKNRLMIVGDFLQGESSANESLTKLAANKGLTVDVETTKVKRAGRAETSEKKKVLKYANKIEKRAKKRTVRAKSKVERKERNLEKRKANVARNRQRLRDLAS